MLKLFLSGVLILACVITLGCGKGTDSGTPVSGTVTFKGQKVPAGMIYFDPDASKGNQGAQGFARIDDGVYDTQVNGRGAPAGAVVVRIEGRTATEPATPLFAHTEQMTVAEGQAVTKDFEVPASAARNVVKSQEPPP